MSEYRVVAPCAYVVDGAAVHHSKAGAVVELPDRVAAELGSAVVELGNGKPVKKRAREPKTRPVPPPPVHQFDEVTPSAPGGPEDIGGGPPVSAAAAAPGDGDGQ